MSVETPTRVAVCGVGAMGSNHARVYAAMPATRLVAVCDRDRARASSVGARFGANSYVELESLLSTESIDAISICVPTSLHASAVQTTLAHNIPTLVEKPLTASLQMGEQLCRLATQKGVLLAVGHIERYNPAVQALKRELLRGVLGSVYQFSARRVGPAPNRAVDIGVILDLMTHDIDVVRYLSGSSPAASWCLVQPAGPESREDLAVAAMLMRDGALVTLEANRVNPEKRREIAVLGEHGMFELNYLTQDLLYRSTGDIGPSPSDQDDNWEFTAQGVYRLNVQRAEPLRAELQSFIGALRGEPTEVVTATDGLQTLRIAQELRSLAASAA